MTPPQLPVANEKGSSATTDRRLQRRLRHRGVLAWPEHPGLVQESDQQVQDSREHFFVAREQKPAIHPRRRLRLLTVLHSARMKRKRQLMQCVLSPGPESRVSVDN